MPIAETRNTNPKNLIPGATGDWEVVIGMEVHAQVASRAKLFSGAPTDFGGAGLFMFRDRKLSNTGRQFLEAVRESGIYRMHMKRHAPRLSSPRDEKRFAFEVSVRVFCNIALDKEPASLYPPETREAVAGMREIAGWISDNREAIAAHDAYRQILDRFEKVVAQMGRLIEMEELLTLKTRSAEHHFPSSVLYDHLRRYLLTDPL